MGIVCTRHRLMAGGPKQILDFIRICGNNVIAKAVSCAMDRSDRNIRITVKPFEIDAVILKDCMGGFLNLDVNVGASEPKIIYLQREWRGRAKLRKSSAWIGARPDLDKAVFAANDIDKSDCWRRNTLGESARLGRPLREILWAEADSRTNAENFWAIEPQAHGKPPIVAKAWEAYPVIFKIVVLELKRRSKKWAFTSSRWTGFPPCF